MITIGARNKLLLFDMKTDKVDTKDLEFWFRVKDDDITYSFPGELQEDNKVKITILPLSEIINFDYLDTSKIYPAYLEVISEGKYSLKTWEGDVQLESPPRVDIKLENVQDVVNNTDSKPLKEKVEPKITTEVSEIIEQEVTKRAKPKSTVGSKKKSSLLEEVLSRNAGKTTIQNKLKKIMR